MPIIKYTGLYNDMLGSKQAKRIEGIKIDDDSEWSKKFFADQKDLRMQLDDFGVGDTINVKMVQSGKFWNILAFEEASAELIDKVAGSGNSGYSANPTATARSSNGGAASTGGGKSSNGAGYGTTKGGTMTKEEWAEKDRLTQIRIAKAVAIKLAMDNTKSGTKPETIMSEANEYVPYLLDPNIPEVDALEPPTE